MLQICFARMKWLCAVVVGLMFLVGSSAWALEIKIQRPGDREFVRDLAGMISPENQTQIRAVCDKLLTEKATPIIVVTIESMAKYGGEDLRIETFATLLFDQFQIGHAKINDQSWNTGILLLVSQGDRKARIELGRGWGRREDQLCQQIMDEQIIPRFKSGEFSLGIVAGVESLDKMARKLELPAAPTQKTKLSSNQTWWYLGLAGVAIFTAVSLFRNGSSGWAWLLWGGLFGLIAVILYTVFNSSDNDSNSGFGGFSGGSFGGGSSGGGGTSGSW